MKYKKQIICIAIILFSLLLVLSSCTLPDDFFELRPIDLVAEFGEEKRVSICSGHDYANERHTHSLWIDSKCIDEDIYNYVEIDNNFYSIGTGKCTKIDLVTMEYTQDFIYAYPEEDQQIFQHLADTMKKSDKGLVLGQG